MVERDLLLQGARLESLQRHADQIELVLRIDGSIVVANDGALHAYGYGRAELLALHVTDLRAAPIPDDAVVQISRAEEGDWVRFETEHRRRDGSTFPVEESSRCFRIDATRYLHCLVRDLTDQRRTAAEREAARRALEESEARFRAMADSAPVLLWMSGTDMGCTWFNRGWLEFTGRSMEQELGFGWTRDIHPEDRARTLELLTTSFHRREPFTTEFRVRRADGEHRWIVGSGKVRLDGQGRFAGYVGSAIDITERRRSEDELRRLEAAVEQTSASIVITDHEGSIEYVNPAFERNTGYARGEVIGRKTNLLKSGRHPPEFYAELWSTISSGRVWNGRIVNRRKDGTEFIEDCVIAPVRNAAGETRNYVAVKRDITNDLALQQHLAESQRLDSVAVLAGGIAHDFNNLLTVVLSCADILRTSPEGKGPNADVIDEIHVAGQRARDLTRQLLAFARRQVIEPIPLDLNKTVVDGERLLRRVLNEDIAIVVKLGVDLWTVRCDPAQIEQVLLNLAVNARDAMPNGGKLVVETANVEVDEARATLFSGIRPGPHVLLAVQDTGAGMTPEVKARAFEPFFTTRPVGKGTGLGLATVHGIVRQSGGFIRIESEPAWGTRFEILFPRTAEAVARPSPSAASSAAGGSEAILVVEDDPHVRRITVRALEASGYEVLVASEAEAALHIVSDRSRRIDLLVSDVVMPGMDGPQLADAVREHRPDVRVLFVSGHAHEVLAHRGIEPGRVQLLDKPYTTGSLLARVREVLDAC